MRKIHIKVLHALNGWIEVAEFYFGEFFVYEVYHLAHTHALAGVGNAHLAQVPVGVYVEAAPLYHAEVGGADELAQGIKLGYAVRHTGEYEVVDG